MKKTKKMLSFVLSMLLIVTMFPTMAFAKEEAKTWKFGELSLKAGDVLGKDTEIKNDAENREIRILSEKTNLDEKKDDKERIKTEKEAVIAAAASWNLKDLTEKGLYHRFRHTCHIHFFFHYLSPSTAFLTSSTHSAL